MRTLACIVVVELIVSCNWSARAADSPIKKLPLSDNNSAIVLCFKGSAKILKVDGTVVKEWKADDVPEALAVRLSPGGKTLAVLRPYDERANRSTKFDAKGKVQYLTEVRHILYKLTLCTVSERLSGPDIELPGDSVSNLVWSNDATKIYASTFEHEWATSYKNLRHWIVDSRTYKATEFKLPKGHHLLDVSPNGGLFLTAGPPPNLKTGRPLWIVPADGSTPVRFTDATENPTDAQFSPDGTKILACGAGLIAAGMEGDGKLGVGKATPASRTRWFDVIEIANGKRTELKGWESRYIYKCRWSPDGRRIGFLLQESTKEFPDVYDELTVAGVDGGEAKVILSGRQRPMTCLDWR